MMFSTANGWLFRLETSDDLNRFPSQQFQRYFVQLRRRVSEVHNFLVRLVSRFLLRMVGVLMRPKLMLNHC